MPKYWGKQNLSRGSFPRSGSKAIDVEREKEERAKVDEYNGQYLSPEPRLPKWTMTSKTKV